MCKELVRVPLKSKRIVLLGVLVMVAVVVVAAVVVAVAVVVVAVAVAVEVVGIICVTGIRSDEDDCNDSGNGD